MVLVLVKCGKISNAQVARSAVIAVLKKLSQLSGKSCDSYHEKAVLAVKKSCGSYHEKAVSVVRKNCLLWAEANDVRWVISDC